jgi:hypothetical protein
MNENKEKYLNFPIQLLAGFIIKPRKVLNEIIDYAIYQNSLKLDLGSDLEKIKTSAKFYDIDLSNAKQTLDKGKILYSSIPDNSPKVGLSISMFFDFYINDKSEFDKVCLLGFLAIKSILGNKSYCKVTNSYLWARMDGKVNSIVEVSELSDEVRKYANRYQTENIKNELILNWNLKYYSHFTRGFYVSLKMSLEDLIYEAEKKRKSLKVNQQKILQKEARERALERLKTEPP